MVAVGVEQDFSCVRKVRMREKGCVWIFEVKGRCMLCVFLNAMTMVSIENFVIGNWMIDVSLMRENIVSYGRARGRLGIDNRCLARGRRRMSGRDNRCLARRRKGAF